MNRNSITLFCFFISFVLFNNCILTRPTDQNVPESKQIQISPENSSTTGSFHTLSNSSENDKKIESKKKFVLRIVSGSMQNHRKVMIPAIKREARREKELKIF